AGLFFGRLIKAAISRQREFLADAASVQFTRNADGMAGALATISAEPGGSLVANRRTETLSHMFFANGVSLWFGSLFATHPPLLERIARIDRRFDPIAYLTRRRPRAAEPPEPDGADALARRADVLANQLRGLAVETRLPIVALAGPSLRRLDPDARQALSRRLQAVVDADDRITLEEAVLLTLARRHLAPAAGRNVPVRFRSIREVRDDARLVLSLLAHAGAGDTAAAFARGAAVLELGADTRALPRDAMEFAKIGDAFERLVMLAPVVKGRLLEAG